MDRWRDRAARRRQTTLYVGVPSPEKEPRALMRRRVDVSFRRKKAIDGACVAVCRRGCHRRVDQPRAPRNLWFPAVEELPGKSPAVMTAAATATATARRRFGGGEGDRNETRSLKK